MADSDLVYFDKVVVTHKQVLVDFCKALAHKYDVTNDGHFRIAYNHLYPLLFHTLDSPIRLTFYYSFLGELDNDDTDEERIASLFEVKK